MRLYRQGGAVPHNERRSLEGRRSQNSGGFTGKAEPCLTTGGGVGDGVASKPIT